MAVAAWIALFLQLSSGAALMYAEDGSAGWLRYAPAAHAERYRELPRRIFVQSDDAVSRNAAKELARGLSAELASSFTVEAERTSAPDLVLRVTPDKMLGEEGFSIGSGERAESVDIRGGSPRALVYAVFAMLENVETGRDLFTKQSPASNIRWTDEWDNLDGSIERGYAGRSIFFDHGHVRTDLTRASEYARLLASVGVNGCNVNNVNADLDLLTSEHLREFAQLAEAFRPWGVRLALSVDLSSPQTVDKLSTFDPLDPTVIAWWQKKVDEVYSLIPDFAGFTIKADSEGRAGPSQYGRSPADAANVLARALRPHGGVVLYRAFVYNHHLDWRDLKADRAKAGYDNFAALDGTFESNVVLQIKHGPIDFQAREPVSPVLAALPHTSEALELQTTQEYTGQQRHMVFLPNMWKWALDTDMRAGGQPSTVASLVTGRRFGQRYGGFVAVTNVGLEANWLHHPMAMANLYGFGKLAWNPGADLDGITRTWAELTWGHDPDVINTVSALLGTSWQTYESYTGPNGMGTLTDILGVHFGPNIESAERNGWGQWFRGDHDAIGMDRTVATGTGYIGQYPRELAAKYESLSTCPDDLLLFFHHVPYAYRLHSGKTLVQSVYDTHYAGALAAAEYVAQWERLHGKIDDERYAKVDDLLTYQAGHAIVWRDAINTWFQQTSGIADEKHRVGHDPNRMEAEEMRSQDYEPVDVTPPETASHGKAVVCKQAAGCTLSAELRMPAGRYNVAVQYFDLRTGVSQYTLLVNHRELAAWKADATLPPAVVRTQMDGQTSTRFTVRDVALRPGDLLELRGVPDLTVHLPSSEDPAGHGLSAASLRGEARELAPVDYIEFGPAGPITPQ